MIKEPKYAMVNATKIREIKNRIILETLEHCLNIVKEYWDVNNIEAELESEISKLKKL